MKHIIAILVLAATLVCGTAHAALPAFEMDQTTPTLLLAGTTAATTSDQLSTTVSLPINAVAVHIYATTTLGSLTNHIITPAGSPTNATSANYRSCPEFNETFTASGEYHIRVPIEELPGRYFGVKYKGTGTATGNFIYIGYKVEAAK